MDLFETLAVTGTSPLAEKIRPSSFEEFMGQAEALAALRPFLDQPEKFPNVVFWGPPGSGKTTFARVLARRTNVTFVNLNAVDTGAREIRDLGEAAHLRKIQGHGRTMVFIDEIHRLNRAQQDILLPFTEAGDFVLVGATTENPSYELNSALLSRARVVVFRPLSRADLASIFVRGARELGMDPIDLLSPDAQETLVDFADGDARRLLSALESLGAHRQVLGSPLSVDDLALVLQKPTLRYDKHGDEHHDTVSAFIKSIRGSDPDAAVYYLARMLAGGEDPLFIARRLVILASEDVGNADPRALTVAVSGLQAVEFVGLPEAAINLAQVTTYLSSAPKSNASYSALRRAQDVVSKTGSLPIPLALRSSRTSTSRELGYGRGYHSAHEGERGWTDMDFLPDAVANEQFYLPVDRGFEKTIKQYLEWMKRGT